MSKDLYGDVEGFDEQPKKKKQTPKRTSQKRKKTKQGVDNNRLDIFKIEYPELSESEKIMMESAVPPSSFPKVKKTYKSDLPLYMRPKQTTFTTLSTTEEEYRLSRNIAFEKLNELILKISIVKDYNTSGILEYIINKVDDLNTNDFIKYISKYFFILNNAENAKFETLIFAIRSQQLSGDILEQAVNDNIKNFTKEDIESEEIDLYTYVNSLVNLTARRPTRPKKVLSVKYPDAEIVNYVLDMNMPIITGDQNTTPVIPVENDYSKSSDEPIVEVRASDSFNLLMKHITDTLEPVPILNPNLEDQRKELVKKLKKSFSPSICCVCNKKIPDDISLKTKRVKPNGKVETDSFCSIEPCFTSATYKIQKTKK